MATYPTLPWMRDGTKIDRQGGFEPVRASNGALKVRRLYSGEPHDFDIEHWLSDAQKSTLESFYGTNKLLDVTLTNPEDGASYTVRFAAAPVYEWHPGYWRTRVRLMEP